MSRETWHEDVHEDSTLTRVEVTRGIVVDVDYVDDDVDDNGEKRRMGKTFAFGTMTRAMQQRQQRQMQQ